jgi:hypothetical protein
VSEEAGTRPPVGHAVGTKKGRHIPLLGGTERETEQKEGNCKENVRQKIKNSLWIPKASPRNVNITLPKRIKGYGRQHSL